MKENELRIGNYVRKKTEIYATDFITIKMAHNYDPIPIDDQWIIQFGFEFEKDFYNTRVKLWQSNSGWNYLTVNKNDFGYEACLGYHLPPNDNTTRILMHESLEYVHQLQNLYYALTGLELEK